ncbi:ThiF family adenylyltransferase [Pseudoflavonifractor sp. P01025]|uniref:ThiF family adenylyltransferase n=1 Tax=Flintibacter porci TaxID=3342383 RepID=UPI0035B6A9F0
MNFSRQRPVKVIMLGAGGTGAHIAPHLYRLLYALDRPVKFIICDGDKVEPKNLIRQNFTQADLGENKAKVIAERYSDAFGLETCYIPTFIEDAKRLEELIRREVYRCSVKHPKTGRSEWKVMSELVILIGAVDNNRSRKLCHDVFQKARELVYIDSGNGEYTGQIVCGIRRAGKTMYQPVGMLYPEVNSPEDLFPAEVSCAEASVSAPQTIVANLMAATAVVTMIYNILVMGRSTVQQTTFSTKSVNIRSIQKQARRNAA